MFSIPAPYVLKPYYDVRWPLWRSSDGEAVSIDALDGFWHVTSVNDHSYYDFVVPDNIQEGSDIEVVANGCIDVNNATGAEKVVYITTVYSTGREGIVTSGSITAENVSIIIPDTELAKYFHKEVVAVLTGLVKGDTVGFRLRRWGTDAADTWAGKYFFPKGIMLRYVADKTGIKV